MSSNQFWEVFVPKFTPTTSYNLCRNPRFLINSDGWQGATRKMINVDGVSVGAETNSGQTAVYSFHAHAAGTYTISANIYHAIGTLSAYDGERTTARATKTTDGWERISVSISLTQGEQCDIRITNTDFTEVLATTSDVDYFDGDGEGNLWQSSPHSSVSIRPSGYIGGSWVSLQNLGYEISDVSGVGVSPVLSQMTDYAIADGARYEQSRRQRRAIVLSGMIGGGIADDETVANTTLRDWHLARLALTGALRVGRPIRIRYNLNKTSNPSKNHVPVEITAYYEGGLEFSSGTRPMSEIAPIMLVAPSPFWSAGKESANIASGQTLAYSPYYEITPNGIVGTSLPTGTDLYYKDRRIVSNGASVYTLIRDHGIYRLDGNSWVYFAAPSVFDFDFNVTEHEFSLIHWRDSVMYGVSDDLWQWDGSWGTLPIGTPYGNHTQIEPGRSDMFNWGKYLVYVNGAATLFDVDDNYNENRLIWSAGNPANHPFDLKVGEYRGVGAVGATAMSALVGPNGNLWICGTYYGSAWVAEYDKELNSADRSDGISENQMEQMAYDGRDLWIFGVGATYLWNGSRWVEQASPDFTEHAISPNLLQAPPAPTSGRAVSSGFVNGSVFVRFDSDPNIYIYDGSSWSGLHIDGGGEMIDLYEVGDSVWVIYRDASSGDISTSSTTLVENIGTAPARPTFHITNTGSESARPYLIKDVDTGYAMYFDCTLLSGETLSVRTGRIENSVARCESSLSGAVPALSSGSSPVMMSLEAANYRSGVLVTGKTRLEFWGEGDFSITAEWDILHEGLDGGAL